LKFENRIVIDPAHEINRDQDREWNPDIKDRLQKENRGPVSGRQFLKSEIQKPEGQHPRFGN
jgi:hypothetical protein